MKTLPTEKELVCALEQGCIPHKWIEDKAKVDAEYLILCYNSGVVSFHKTRTCLLAHLNHVVREAREYDRYPEFAPFKYDRGMNAWVRVYNR